MMTARRFLVGIACLLALLLCPSDGALGTRTLEADSSPYLVKVSAGFTGTDFLVFGAREGPGDVVIVIRGPNIDYSVRRKQRVFGIWVNTDKVSFGDVPSFYAVASSRLPLDDVLSPSDRGQQGIGLDRLQLPTVKRERESDIEAFQSALIRLKQKAGLFGQDVGRVEFPGSRLFRTTVHLPSNVPTGTYYAEVLFIHDGEIDKQSVPLTVDKSGLGAFVFQSAHDYAPAYGLSAIAGALLLGWIAHLVFRKL